MSSKQERSGIQLLSLQPKTELAGAETELTKKVAYITQQIENAMKNLEALGEFDSVVLCNTAW